MAATRRPDTLARERAHELVRSWDGRPGALGSLLEQVSSVDQVGVEERVDALKKRSIKKQSKLWALDLAIRMMDLTTLEGKDTPGKVRALCQKAMTPQPGDPTIPSVAAICVYPALVGATPLLVALGKIDDDDHGVVNILLNAGADVDAENTAGVSPRSLAERVSNRDLMKYLRPTP